MTAIAPQKGREVHAAVLAAVAEAGRTGAVSVARALSMAPTDARARLRALVVGGKLEARHGLYWLPGSTPEDAPPPKVEAPTLVPVAEHVTSLRAQAWEGVEAADAARALDAPVARAKTWRDGNARWPACFGPHGLDEVERLARLGGMTLVLVPMEAR